MSIENIDLDRTISIYDPEKINVSDMLAAIGKSYTFDPKREANEDYLGGVSFVDLYNDHVLWNA